ncbi:MAG: hypothetical protein R2747_16990 [Pyrinomonadaceae bacterium]
MKQLILLILAVLFVAASTPAQPTGSKEDRVLERDLRNLTRRIETLKKLEPTTVDNRNENRVARTLEAAESELAEFKGKHPDYDVSGFDRDIADFKKKLEESLADRDQKAGKIDDFTATVERILDFRPDARKFLADEENAAAETEKQLSDFQDEMNRKLTPDFLELAGNPDNREIRNLTAKVQRNARSALERLSGLDLEKLRTAPDENGVLMRYFDILFARERYRTLGRIFGNDAEIEAAAEKAGGMIDRLGTLAEMKELGRKNRAELVAAARMDPEVQNNPALKKEFIRAFRSNIARPKILGPDNILRVHLISRDWSVERNKLTGIILNRRQYAQFVLKAPDGRCFLYTFIMQQNNKGSYYGPGFGVGNSEREMLCENVP